MLTRVTNHEMCNRLMQQYAKKNCNCINLKTSNSPKTRPHRKTLTTVLKSALQNYPENALKLQ